MIRILVVGIVFGLLASCGDGSEKICSVNTVKEVKTSKVKFKMDEQSCVYKYQDSLKYKLEGGAAIYVAGDTTKTVSIDLGGRGTLTSANGTIAVKNDNEKGLRVRLIAGNANFQAGDKKVQLELLKMLEMK